MVNVLTAEGARRAEAARRRDEIGALEWQIEPVRAELRRRGLTLCRAASCCTMNEPDDPSLCQVWAPRGGADPFRADDVLLQIVLRVAARFCSEPVLQKNTSGNSGSSH